MNKTGAIFSLALTGLVSLQAFADKHNHEKQTGHKAHEHGSANMNVVVEAQKVTVEFESPAESIYGFEHEAKSEKDKKKQQDAFEILKKKTAEIFTLDAKSECVWQEPKVEVKKGEEEGHSEVAALFIADCKKPLTGSKLMVDFSKHFKKLGKIKTQVVSGNKQSGKTIVKKSSIDL
jgi:Protein of unknown function (DUF2796)